ncbi:MAG: hypothetical protein PHE50_05770 [Dehalococcoidales bacterium]|nr:hypothetical protein [Dehalococcoidales bacterium]
MVARRRPDTGSQINNVCPKCGKNLVLSQPDGTPLLDGYVHMECASCGDKTRYTVIKPSVTNAPVPQKTFLKFYLPIIIIVVCFSLAIANVRGWISLPNLLSPGSGGGNIVGSWVSGDTTLTFNSNGAYTMTLGGQIFDTGTYTTNGGQMTMTSRAGRSSTASYRMSGNTLTGFHDGRSSNLTTYTRISN